MTHHEMMQMISRKAREIQSRQPVERTAPMVDRDYLADFDEQFAPVRDWSPIGSEAISDDMFVTEAEWRGER